jgi:putative transposase
MIEKFELFLHFIVTLIKLSKPGGAKVVMAENHAMRQQLNVLARSKSRSPKLTSFDRIFFGCTAFFIGEKRLQKVAIILKPATILKFHKALVSRKYRKLYSCKTKKAPGRKPQDQAVIDLIVEMKQLNLTIGYGRIAMQLLTVGYSMTSLPASRCQNTYLQTMIRSFFSIAGSPI